MALVQMSRYTFVKFSRITWFHLLKNFRQTIVKHLYIPKCNMELFIFSFSFCENSSYKVNKSFLQTYRIYFYRANICSAISDL